MAFEVSAKGSTTFHHRFFAARAKYRGTPSRRRALFTTDYHELILDGSSIIFAVKLPLFQQAGTNNKERKNEAICWNQIFPGIRRHETIKNKNKWVYV